MFDKKDKKSEKIQKNFSDFWSKFVSFAPEVPFRVFVLVQAAVFLVLQTSGPWCPAPEGRANRLSHVLFRLHLRVHVHSVRDSLFDLGCMVLSAGRHAHAARAPLLPVAPCHVHVSAPGFSHRSAFQSFALRTLNSGACFWHVSS